MNSFATTFLILAVLLVLLPSHTYAFGAGDIPDFSYLNGKAFRHGDIEGILAELAKATGHVGGGGGLLDFAQSVLSAATSGSKFSKEDVKRVYFGNWLRDYSQAMDIAGLGKLSADTILDAYTHELRWVTTNGHPVFTFQVPVRQAVFGVQAQSFMLSATRFGFSMA